MIVTLSTFYEMNVRRIHVKRTKVKSNSYKEHLKWLNLGMTNTTILITTLKAKLTFTQSTTLNTRSNNDKQICVWNRPAVSVLLALKHKLSQKTQQKWATVIGTHSWKLNGIEGEEYWVESDVENRMKWYNMYD